MRKASIVIILFIIISLSSSVAAMELRPVVLDTLNPVAYYLSPELRFYMSFDGQLDEADLAIGSGTVLSRLGKPEVVKGLYGNALMVGGDKGGLEFQLYPNVELSTSGTLVFWVMPVDWKVGNELSFAWIRMHGLSSNLNGVVNVTRSGSGTKRISCSINGFSHMPSVSASTVASDTWQNNEWHLIALNWGRGWLEIVVDGFSNRRVRLRRPIRKDEVSAGILTIGYLGGPMCLIDEFMVTRRMLTISELREIYEAGQERE